MISSPRNETIKQLRRLRRSRGQLALLEGPHLLAEALKAGRPLETVLASPAFASSPEGTQLLAMWHGTPLLVAPQVLVGLTDADSPQGILAVARLPREGAGALPVRAGGIYVFADGLQDPGNLGALARVAEAAGASGLALAPGTVSPNHPRALRASAGSLLRLPTAVQVAPAELDGRLQGLAARWVALAPRGGHLLDQSSLDGALVLAVGAEGRGLSPEIEGRASLRITIPMAPPVESLNAMVAASLVLFEVRRQRGWRF